MKSFRHNLQSDGKFMPTGERYHALIPFTLIWDRIHVAPSDRRMSPDGTFRTWSIWLMTSVRGGKADMQFRPSHITARSPADKLFRRRFV